MHDAGDHAGVIAKVRKARREPRGKKARIYARSLTATGQVDEARSALQWSFRHGSDRASLVALADLELALGLDGIAAAHYSRVITLEPTMLEGRAEVCSLLRRRAEALTRIEEGVAADRDLRRARLLCGAPIEPEEVALEARVLAIAGPMAEAQVRAMRALPRCEEGGCGEEPRSSGEGALRSALRVAAARGPVALRAEAARREASLEPAEVLSLLEAELRGQLGAGLMDDGELRARVGDRAWAELAAAAVDVAPGARDYALLRLSYVRRPDEDLASARERWVRDGLRALGGPGAPATRHGWRILARVGDLDQAELELGAGLRALAVPRAPAPEPAPSRHGEEETPPVDPWTPHQRRVAPPDHWSARVAVVPGTAVDLLDLGRLRAHRGKRRLGLEIHRFVLAEALAAGIPMADVWLEEEVRRRLAQGRGWEALALVELHEPLRAHLEPAIASALRLEIEACGSACTDEDRALVEAALGASWAEAVAARIALEAPAAMATTTPGPCPQVAQLMASDRRAMLVSPDVEGSELVATVERDVALGCEGGWAARRLLDAHHQPAAATLSERLAHTPELEGARVMLVAAIVDLAAGDHRRAALHLRAAAGSSAEPRRIWILGALAASDAGEVELELEALRQALLHTPGLDSLALRRGLLIARLSDVDRDHFVREGDRESVEAMRRSVREHLELLPAAQRWAELERLAVTLSHRVPADELAATRRDELLWSGVAVNHHPEAAERLLVARGESLGPAVDLELDPGRAGLRSAADAVPLALLGARALQARAWSLGAREGSARAREGLVAVLVLGSPTERARAARRLRTLIAAERDPSGIDDLLLRLPVAGRSEAGEGAIPALPGEELKARIVTGRPLGAWAIYGSELPG